MPARSRCTDFAARSCAILHVADKQTLVDAALGPNAQLRAVQQQSAATVPYRIDFIHPCKPLHHLLEAAILFSMRRSRFR
jgi:hypothetical protein